MLFVICADRGAPGSTTTTLALASARGLPALVVEADPYGGDLPLRLKPDGRHPLASTPTVLGTAAGRSPAAPTAPRPGSPPAAMRVRHLDLWRSGSQRLTSLVRVVPGFMTAEQGASMAWPALTSTLEAQSTPVFADVGRIHAGSPSMPILAAADAVLPVCRGDMASVQHLLDRMEALAPAIAERSGRPPRLLPVVVAPRRHGDAVAKSVWHLLARSPVSPALHGVGWLAWDPQGCGLLETGADPWQKPLRNSVLMDSARRLLRQLGSTTGMDHDTPKPTRRRRAAAKRQPTEPPREPWPHETGRTALPTHPSHEGASASPSFASPASATPTSGPGQPDTHRVDGVDGAERTP